ILHADCSRAAMAARRGRKSNVANLAFVDGLHWPSVFHAFVHGPSFAGLVQPGATGKNALPAVCVIQCGLAPGAGELSLCVRAGVHAPDAGRNLVLVFRIFRPVVRHLWLSALANATEPLGNIFFSPGGSIGCPAPDETSQSMVVRIAGVRVGVAAGNDK